MFLARVLSFSVAAALVATAAPGVSQAAVRNTPASGFPSFNDTVHAISHRGPTVYVGGEFNTVTDAKGNTYNRSGAAAVDVRTGAVLPWNPRVRGEVRDLVATRQGVYLVGQFDQVKRQPRRHVARVSLGGPGKLARKFRPRPNLPVNAVTLSKKRIYLGGTFSAVNGVPRTKLAAVGRRAPFKLTGWRPKAQNGVVFDLVRKKAGIYVAGEFRSLNGKAAYQRLALVRQGRAGGLVGSFNPSTFAAIIDISVTKRRVYAAVGGPRGGGAMSIVRSSGATHWNRRFDGDVQAIAPMKGLIYVGGHFNTICDSGSQQVDGVCTGGSSSRLRGASLHKNGSLGAWDPRGNGDLGINAFDRYARADRLLVGGDFTTMGSTGVRRFAVFNSLG